jgi:hypothetical protein
MPASDLGTIRRYRRSGSVQKAEEYRKHAEECRMLAGRSRAPAEREMLLNMAKTWDDLAKARASNRPAATHEGYRIPVPAGRIRFNPASIPIDKLNASNDE